MMRIALLASLLALSACATGPGVAPAPRAVVEPPVDLVSMLESAGSADAASAASIRARIGEADIARQDGAGLMLTYRLEQCALALVFTSDARNQMRLRETIVGPRRVGDAPPSLRQCAASAEARSAGG